MDERRVSHKRRASISTYCRRKSVQIGPGDKSFQETVTHGSFFTLIFLFFILTFKHICEDVKIDKRDGRVLFLEDG